MTSPIEPAVRRCQQCGAPLGSDEAGERCLRCALEHALEDSGPKAASTSTFGRVSEGPALSLSKGPSSTGGLSSQRFGDYELLEEIARGGMGVVYKARQVSLDRIVAVKLLLFGPLASKEFVQRFRVEATAAASLQHPNIVSIHEVGVRQGQQFLTMDFVEGRTLAQLVADQPLPAKRAAGYVKAIAEAINYAHERGILHRDLKPSNVLIDAHDQPRVTDFGLAKRFGNPSRVGPEGAGGSAPGEAGTSNDLTITGQVLGSPSYMPPEQAAAKGGKVGKPSDVYSLGAILYHLLTGRPPFVGESLTETLHQVLNAEPISPRLLSPSLPPDLETICLKCLEKETGQRYATAQALADELSRFLNDEPIQARPVSTPEKCWRWCRRKPIVASLATALVLASAAGFIGVLWQLRRAEQNATKELRQRLRAEAGESAARQTLYAVEMNLAYHAWQAGNGRRARELLELQRPKAGEEDVRDFDWRWLWRLCHDESLFKFRGHSGFWKTAAYSPDGKTVATGGADKTIKLWDLAARAVVTNLTGHTQGLWTLAFSPGAKILASATGALFPTMEPGELKLWDVESRQEIAHLEGHKLWFWSLAFSPDGKILASANEDGTVKLWDMAAKKELRRPLRGHAGGVLCVAFSPDGKTIATAGADGTARFWEVSSERESSVFMRFPVGIVASLAFSRDGKTLALCSGDYRVQLWDRVAQQLKASLPSNEPVVSAAFSPDGDTLAFNSGSAIKFWSVGRMEELGSLAGFSERISTLMFSPDGKTLISINDQGDPFLWDSEPKQKIETLHGHTDSVMSVAFSPDGKILATGSGEYLQPIRTSEVKLWDVAARHELETLPAENGTIYSLVFSPDGKTLAWAGKDTTIKLLDIASQPRRPIAILRGHTEGVLVVAFSPDGRTLASAGGTDKTARLWDVATRQPKRVLEGHTDLVRGVAFSHDGQTLMTCAAGDDQSVRVWNVSNGQAKHIINARGPAMGLALSPDGTMLAVCVWQVVRLYEFGSWKELGRLAGHQHVLQQASFSPGGKLLATASIDGTVKLWNLAAKQEVATLRGHVDAVNGVAFSADGKILASVGRDKTVRLWRAPSFAEIEAADSRK